MARESFWGTARTLCSTGKASRIVGRATPSTLHSLVLAARGSAGRTPMTSTSPGRSGRLLGRSPSIPRVTWSLATRFS